MAPLDVWKELASNAAVVAVFFGAWSIAQDRLASLRRPLRQIVFGVFMGSGAVASMLLSVEMQPGVIFDLRAVVLSLAGFFAGPFAALAAASIAAAYRGWLGGPGAASGLSIIGLVTLIGLLGHILRAKRSAGLRDVLTLAVIVAATSVVMLLMLPRQVGSLALSSYGPPIALLVFLSTAVFGAFVIQSQKIAKERDLLRSAFIQAPDFQYIKDPRSQFVAVNDAVALHNGFARPSDMRGKTDYDLTDNHRAEGIYKLEQGIIRSGQPIFNHEEGLVGVSGEERWYSTSKVALRNSDGEVIGLAGVTRDITEQRRIAAELTDSRNLLSYAVGEMADGLAMFDRTGRLVFCNERYRTMFPLTGAMRQPGVSIQDILQAVLDTGEQLELGDPNAWVQTVADSLRKEGEEHVSLFDGRWLLIRTRPTAEGASMVLVSDVTTIKKAEGELRILTTELKHLAETDGLTGLTNRRSFDLRFSDEITRSGANGTSLSIVLFDVDHFKAYNDTYGHLAGDECLKIVAHCLSSSLLRDGDLAARYGGEEFAAILPGTGEDSAFLVADRVKKAVENLKLPHSGTKRGFVTLSAGVATYAHADQNRSIEQLIARADEALYQAKHAGRNRVMGWRAHDAATFRDAG